ncbi:adenylate/guanylate cyclase domain-containing protein [Sneathiella chungangensis]|uniref:Adenylate/guanylate cyclase domain-containing protein n=1 Tax=Sneathiella chungangensis TaxID=1418234 RepID=A0A845MFZ6_9PROT|nr:adenylate/guanylate cyclase domain-containing protein [Sneathiella chungangensis]MZR22542.1 adenylate/guanylate cyclase domain-containing protein [Sneathiella chungangensis]
MTEASLGDRLRRLRHRDDLPDPENNRFLYEALDGNKREGLMLAVRARTVSLAVIAAFLIYLNPHWSVLYYEILIAGFLLIGWAQVRFGRVERSRIELFLILLDLALMTIILVVPNPWDSRPWSVAMQFKYGNFPYFFILLAAATLAYSWRTLLPITAFTAVLWMGGYFWAINQPNNIAELSEKVRTALEGYPNIAHFADPGSIPFEPRIQEVLIFALVAGILGLNSWRSNRLLVRQAGVARERANLSRHFPPNIVDNLAERDQPLGDVRAQPVAVLFADIVGFTKMAESETPERIVEVLREFHGRMEACVFENNGTLDKFLGDGLMATFGTPETTPEDAENALRCAAAMHQRMKEWNERRKQGGLTPIRLSIGIHYGTVVLGDIGSERRLEYAVLGDVVNVASRLEALTRQLNAHVVVSGALIDAAGGSEIARDMGFLENGVQTIRGRDETVKTWIRPLTPGAT